MVITETITISRECCQPQDIVTMAGNQRRSRCMHCGQEFRQRQFCDAAGDMDYEWVKIVQKREGHELFPDKTNNLESSAEYPLTNQPIELQ